MTDPWLMDALRDMRRITALRDNEAYPALEAWLDRWQLAQGLPTMGDLLNDPDCDRREVREAMVRLRTNIQKEYVGKAKILTWHASQMRTEVARLRQDFPRASQDMDAELTALETDALARAEQLAERIRALPERGGRRGRGHNDRLGDTKLHDQSHF
jgi:hypothetical protein